MNKINMKSGKELISMKTFMAFILLMIASIVCAQPLRVAVLDFENEASIPHNDKLLGGIKPKAIAEKGVYALAASLVNQDELTLIDRRDFMRQLQASPTGIGDKAATARPSFLRAAQAVNADVVLRGILLSYAPGKQIVNQGGYKTDFLVLSLRVALQALDTSDGTVIAMAEGTAKRKFRQSASLQTVLSEDDLQDMLKTAIENAVPSLTDLLQKRIAKARTRPKVKLSVKTSDDPALVEIDGLLIGTTPLKEFDVYAGDHLLTVGKAGYRDVNKRIMLKSSTSIEVPLIRTELNADELKEVLKTMRMNVILGIPEPPLVINTIKN